MKFEYQVTVLDWPPIHKAPTKESVEAMNVAGEHGWEMVGVSPRTDANGYIREIAMFWKRPKSEGAE